MSSAISTGTIGLICCFGLVALAPASETGEAESSLDRPAPSARWTLKSDRLGGTIHVHRAGPVWLAGQPTKDTVKNLKSTGVGTVITLRQEDELSWDERELVESIGLTFVPLRFRSPDDLTDEMFDRARKILRKAKSDRGVLLHCASANRVGAIWIAFRMIDSGWPEEAAVAEASEVGLRSDALKQRALDYAHRRMKDGNPADR